MNQAGEKTLPLVSVGIVTYNQKEYLRECIESVLAQDYLNIEIVVGDDASTDGTQEMLREYKAKYPEKFVLKFAETNKGITGNSNTVFFSCSGKYVHMVAGDDLMLPGKIRKQANFLETHKDYTLCGTYTKLINEMGQEIGIKKDYKKRSNPSYTLCDLIESGNSLVPAVSYMFRRDAAPLEGYDCRLPIASDGLFMNHVASKGKIFILKEVLTAYRVHASHAKSTNYSSDVLLTHALNEFYFPECCKAIYRRKSKALRNIGIRNVLNGKIDKSSYYFRMSLYCKLSLLSLGLFILSKTELTYPLVKIAKIMQRRWI